MSKSTHLIITGYVPYDPEESYFPGATKSSPPTVAKALSVYKDELVRPVAFDLGSKGDSRNALRGLCQKAVLEISPTLETVLLQSSIVTDKGPVLGASGAPSLAQLALAEQAERVDKAPPKTRAVRAPRQHSNNLDEDTRLCIARNKQNVAEQRKLEAQRQELLHMPDLFREQIMDMDEEMQALQTIAAQERVEMETHIVNRVMNEFLQQHEERLQQINAEFDEEVLELRKQFVNEEKRQMHKQERSFLSIISTATRKLQKGKTCDCRHQYMCRHNKTASYNTRHVSRLVLTYRSNAKRLAAKGNAEEAAQWEARANEIDAEEEEKWREDVAKSITHSTWGAGSAKVDSKAELHKKDLKHLKAAQEVRITDLLARQEHKLRLWESSQAAEERRVRMQCKKMIKDIFMKAVTGKAKTRSQGYIPTLSASQVAGGGFDGNETYVVNIHIDDDDEHKLHYELAALGGLDGPELEQGQEQGPEEAAGGAQGRGRDDEAAGQEVDESVASVAATELEFGTDTDEGSRISDHVMVVKDLGKAVLTALAVVKQDKVPASHFPSPETDMELTAKAAHSAAPTASGAAGDAGAADAGAADAADSGADSGAEASTVAVAPKAKNPRSKKNRTPRAGKHIIPSKDKDDPAAAADPLADNESGAADGYDFADFAATGGMLGSIDEGSPTDRPAWLDKSK